MNVVLKSKKNIFVVITYVVNLAGIVSKQKLKFMFFGGSWRSECSDEMKLHIFYSSPWRSERCCDRDLISFFGLEWLSSDLSPKIKFFIFFYGHGVVNIVLELVFIFFVLTPA